MQITEKKDNFYVLCIQSNYIIVQKQKEIEYEI